MSLERAFNSMVQRCHQLIDGLSALRTTAVEDRPLGRDVPLVVERLGDDAEDLVGHAGELLDLARNARRALTGPRNLEAARDALMAYQRGVHPLLSHILSLTTGDAVRERERLRRRSKQWKAWIRTIEQSLATVQSAVCSCFDGLGDCWDELSDRLSTHSVTANATVNGQQFVTAAEHREGALR